MDYLVAFRRLEMPKRKTDVLPLGGGMIGRLRQRTRAYEAGSPAAGAKAMGAEHVSTGKRKPMKRKKKKTPRGLTPLKGRY